LTDVDLSVNEWTPEEVANWLTANGFGEYRNEFINNDVRGRELVSLGRNDLKVNRLYYTIPLSAFYNFTAFGAIIITAIGQTYFSTR
jgi:SAM domain (Sterile alpha motif)